MKKRILLFSGLFIVVAALAIVGLFLCNKVFYCKSIQSLTGLKISDYDKITLFNGDNGKGAEITNRVEIQSILSHFYDTKLKVRSSRDIRDGGFFSVELYKGGKRIATVGNVNVYIHNGEMNYEKLTQYEMKTNVPSHIIHSIFKKYGVDTIYEERPKE